MKGEGLALGLVFCSRKGGDDPEYLAWGSTKHEWQVNLSGIYTPQLLVRWAEFRWRECQLPWQQGDVSGEGGVMVSHHGR